MSQTNKDIIFRLFDEVWSRGSLPALDELLDPGYSAYIPLVGKVDRAGLKQAVTLFRKAFPDLRFEIKDSFSDGNKSAIQWTATGTSKGEFMGYPPNGKPAVVNGLSIVELREGRIWRDASQYDVPELMRALGMQLPQSPAAQASAQPELRH